jgi:hypothetical protein
MNDTSNELEERSTDPMRFAGMGAPAVKRERRAGEVLGSGLALLALVVGLPALLLVLAGAPPIPTSFPSMRDFAQQLSFEDLLTVLVGVVWLAWLYFVVCVVVEVIAARRGGMARAVPLAGPLQKLAQVLVGVLMMSGIMAGTAQAATPVVDNAATTSSVAVSVAEGAAVASDNVRPEVTVPQSDQAGDKVYTVKAPQNGYHDNLWDIAEKHLGAGQRYKEIYELNKDRVQPDGRKLELARLIQPGWDLVMPDDAVGVARQVAPEAPAADTAPVVTDLDAGLASDAQATHDAVVSDAPDWQAGAGLLAAGVIGALAIRRRQKIGRRPDDDALEVETDFRIAAALARSAWLDGCLRSLALQCRREGVALPPVYGAVVDDDSVELLLAPAVPDAVGEWTVLANGRRWRYERTDNEIPSLREVAPYPALVSLGIDDQGRDVMVDLEAAGGIVSLVGDTDVAEEVAAAIAVQAATTAWSGAVRVIASGLPNGLEQIGDDRIRVTDDLRAELPELEEQITGLREEVLSGRLRRRGQLPSYLVVCGHAPEREVAERLGALAGVGRQSFSVVVAGEHKAARWRLRVDEHGILTVPLLDLTLTANRIDPSQVSAVAELFIASREPDRPEDGDRVRIPEPLRPHDDAAWTTATRRVGVLGRVTVQGAGDLPADRTAIATELVTFLALHPEGVHPHVLGGILWPRGVTADVQEATITRARQWLGSAADGSHLLRSDVDGRLSLADEVVCDWDCARTLLIGARGAASPADEADLLRRALKLVRGEVFDGVPEGRYGWIARDDVTRTMVRVVVDGAHRLAELFSDDDPGGAAMAAESGLRISPGSQRLWRDLMRARYAETGVAGVQRTLDQMSEALHSIPLEPETEALAQELLPEAGSMAAGS